MPKFQLLYLLLSFCVLLAVGCSRSASNEELQALSSKLQESVPQSLKAHGIDASLWESTRKFYETRQGRPAWIQRGKPSSRVDDLERLLAGAADEGLDPAHYGAGSTKGAKPGKDDAAAMELELALTASLMRYSRDLALGRPIAKQIDPGWTPTPRKIDLAQIVAGAVDGNDLDELPARLAPPHPEYARLRQELQRARTAQDQERARRIALNLERWRWLPDDLGASHVLVNVPAFALQVREEQEKVALQMKVIVGKETNRTPIFSDTMTHIVFSPYWNIPQSIEMKEMLPKITEDPDFLAKNEIEVLQDGKSVDPRSIDWDELEDEGNIKLRQRPGAENALGFVKFLFPNRHNVYLHDTPHDNLFDKLTRDLSHGCVRVEKPVDLAHYVLKDHSEWTPERIDEAMHAGQEKHVALRKAIPVHLAYLTVRVEADGQPQFFDDVYGYDARQAELAQDATLRAALAR